MKLDSRFYQGSKTLICNRGPTTPSQHGLCHPTSSQWAPQVPQEGVGTQMSTSDQSHPSHYSSSWWPQGPLGVDTGSWSSGGSRWPSPCHGGLETELPLWPAVTMPTPAEQGSCWRDQSFCCTSSQLPQFILLRAFCAPDVLFPGVMCNLLLTGQIQDLTWLHILR